MYVYSRVMGHLIPVWASGLLSKIGSYHSCHLSGHWATVPPRWGVWARLPSEGALIAARVPGGTGGSGEGGAGNKGSAGCSQPLDHVIHSDSKAHRR